MPVLCFCDCTSPVLATEGTAEWGVQESTLAESFCSQNRESTVGWPEPHSQTFADRKELTVATAACL